MSNETTATYLERTDWPSGEWDAEPDRVSWTDDTTGLPCLARRHDTLGHLCGYVAVPPGHPLHGKDYDDPRVLVHGGLTYAGECSGDPDRGICHRPEPGQPDDVWWFGFDCAHCGDASPGMARYSSLSEHDDYRSLDYVRAEVTNLAAQLVALS